MTQIVKEIQSTVTVRINYSMIPYQLNEKKQPL